MSFQRRFRKFLDTIFREDLKIIIIFLFFTMSLLYGYTLILGMLTNVGISFTTPAHDGYFRAIYDDTDGDLLVDVIEDTPAGEPLTIDGRYIGIGTGTDASDRDSDNDGFTDGAENNFGTNPNSWINPGFVWIVWILAVVVYFISTRRKGDMLKEYREFDEDQKSAGVAIGDSKYAYGGATIFSKRIEDMSAEEKNAQLEQDGRYQRMMGLAEPEPPDIKSNKTKQIVQVVIVSIAVLIGRYIWTEF